jgi:CRP-like cAMP-binding protein
MTSKFELRVLTQLRAAELMKGMESDHLKKMATMATEVEFAKDEIIYQKGVAGKAIYLIVSGQVVIETNVPNQGQIVMNTLEPGQFFGWSALFPAERKMAWTRALTPTRVFAFDAAQLRNAFQADHNLEYAIVRRAGRAMTDRIRATRQQLTEMMEEDQ